MGLLIFMLPEGRCRQWLASRLGKRDGDWWIIANKTAIRVWPAEAAKSGKPQVNVRDLVSRL
jgi:hypothetical protein